MMIILWTSWYDQAHSQNAYTLVVLVWEMLWKWYAVLLKTAADKESWQVEMSIQNMPQYSSSLLESSFFSWKTNAVGGTGV